MAGKILVKHVPPESMPEHTVVEQKIPTLKSKKLSHETATAFICINFLISTQKSKKCRFSRANTKTRQAGDCESLNHSHVSNCL